MEIFHHRLAKNSKLFRVYGLIFRFNLDNMHFDKVTVFDYKKVLVKGDIVFMEKIYSSEIANTSIIEGYLLEKTAVFINIEVNKIIKADESIIVENNRDVISVSNPFKDDSEVVIDPDKMLHLKIYPADCHYIDFVSKVISIFTENNESFIKIAKPAKIIRYQRRSSFRVFVNINASFTFQNKDGESKKENIHILDLSVGGALLAGSIDCNIGDKGVLIAILSTSSGPISLQCEIQRIYKMEGLGVTFDYIYGSHFLSMDDLTEKSLFKFINKVQVKEKAKQFNEKEE